MKPYVVPSGSTRPEKTQANVSNCPASALLSDVVNSVGCRLTLKPAFPASDWITAPSLAFTESVPSIRLTEIGVFSPDAFTSLFARARLCFGHLNVGSRHAFRAGEIGLQSGKFRLLKTTLLIVFRSSESSKALRSAECLASGVPTFWYGCLRPVLLPMLSVRPW